MNPHAGADDVLIYLEGGGACANAATCWGAQPAAANVAGYDATVFATAKQRAYPALSRTLAANPFQAVNMVYVPYCTGDMHGGTKETDLVVNGVTKPTYFWGARDLDIFLARLVPTFAAAKRIWLAGTSAGGFGSVLVYSHVVSAFATRVDILDDSGPAIAAKSATDNAGSFSAWGFVPPSGCTGCTSHAAVLAFDRALQPQSRYGFLSFSEDTVISKDFGYTLDEYPGVLSAFFATSLANDANAKTFGVTTKQSHVVESDPASALTYLPWMTKMKNDDASWRRNRTDPPSATRSGNPLRAARVGRGWSAWGR